MEFGIYNKKPKSPKIIKYIINYNYFLSQAFSKITIKFLSIILSKKRVPNNSSYFCLREIKEIKT